MLKKLVVAAALVTVASLSAQELPPPFPRPNATKLLETDAAVVWNIVWPKGEPSPLHRHVYDQVGTYYARGGRKITNTDGTARETMTEVGSISTTRKGTTHIEEGTTDPPLRAVFLELKREEKTGDRGMPPPPRPGAKLVHDERRAHVWDVTTLPGAPASSFITRFETVIVWVGEGTERLAIRDVDAETIHVVPGMMRQVPKGVSVIETVVSGAPRQIIFELE